MALTAVLEIVNLGFQNWENSSRFRLGLPTRPLVYTGRAEKEADLQGIDCYPHESGLLRKGDGAGDTKKKNSCAKST